jgi:hypothetical protein
VSKREEKRAEKYKALKERSQAEAEEDRRKPEDPHTEYDKWRRKWVPKK